MSVRNGATGETNFLPGVASQQQQGWEFRVCFSESDRLAQEEEATHLTPERLFAQTHTAFGYFN